MFGNVAIIKTYDKEEKGKKIACKVHQLYTPVLPVF